jgi:hypothetical protein
MAVSIHVPIIFRSTVLMAFSNSSLTAACSTAIIGFIIAIATTNTGARYFAIFVFTTGVYSISGINLGWVVSTCGQTKEKRAVSLAVVNTISNVATIYTPVSLLPLVGSYDVVDK